VIGLSLGRYTGIGEIISEIDWQSLADSAGGAIKELVAGLYGYADWDSLASDFNKGVEFAFAYARNYSMKDFQSAWAGFIESLKGAFQTFLDWAHAQAAATPGRNVMGGGDGYGQGFSGNRRASGGAVIAGQQYKVAEFNRPEMFTPSSNGRIDPLQPAGAMAGMGDDVFIQRFADVIARSLRSEMQKSGRK